MQPTTALFQAAIKAGYQFSSLVEVYDSNNTLLKDSTTFNVVGGSITVDGSANFQRSVNDLTIVDNTGLLVPTAASDLFSVVSNNVLKLYTGMVRPDGVVERLPQGVFTLEGAAVHDSDGDLEIKVSAYDMARKISRNKFTKAYKIARNTDYLVAIQNLIANRISPQAITFVVTGSPGYTTPYITIDPQTDPWDQAQKMAESCGYEIFFDVQARCILRPVPDPNDPNLVPVWTYQEGVDSTLLEINRASSNEEVFNYVIVSGENSLLGITVRGAAWDSDVTSPTYAGIPEGAGSVVPPGPYGLVVEFYADEKVRLSAQATASAQARINTRKGATEVVDFSIVPNPAHEVGDVVKVIRAKSKFDSTKSLILDKFNLGLSAADGAMKITCRQRRV